MAGYSKLIGMENKKFNAQDERELLSPPGDSILEALEVEDISMETFAAMMAGNDFDVAGLISGKEPLTEGIAQELERALDIPAQFWINREKLYRKKLAWIEEQEKKYKIMGQVKAPFTDEQVLKLKAWQDGTKVFAMEVGDKLINVPGHPFTCCGHDGCKRKEQPHEGALIPSNEGWACPCGKYKQNWCHDFMVE
jgi:plasmid maintenance system antidote protein VapI